MALGDTFITYNGDGVTTDFSIPFAYDDQAEVVVTRKNGAVTFTFLNANTIRITSPAALAVGDTLSIQRVTNIDNPKVVFKNGGSTPASQFNSVITQLIRGLNEVRDTATRALYKLASGVFDAGNARITNVGAPTAPSDAARYSDLTAIQLATGNVPSPTAGQVGYNLEATGAGAFGWTAKGAPADGSITPAKLSTGGPSWTSGGDVTTIGELFGPANDTIASAATCSIFAKKAKVIQVTGTTGITSFGSGSSGQIKVLTFAGAVTLTNGASLSIPGNANYTTAAGDRMIVASNGGTSATVIGIFKADGKPVVNPYLGVSVTTTVLTSGTGSFTPQASTRFMRVRGKGGGGGSGGTAATGTGANAASAGGGEGGFFEHLYSTVAGSYSYAVGAGGSAATAGNNPGGNGGATTFGTLTANGGNGGGGGTTGTASAANPGAGAGGTASGANVLNVSGQAGGPGLRNVGMSTGGQGGGAFGGAVVAMTSVGNAGGPGCGGSGSAAGQSTAAQAGAAGGNGYIIIEEFA